MTVVNTTAASNATSTAQKATTANSNTVNYDAFLKLFMAELKNQDPTSPADPTAFISQLATFSTVEQSVKTNTKLDELRAISVLAQADALIGHTVTTSDGITGKVAAIRADSGSAVAILEDGTEVTMGEGVKIS